MKKITGMQLRMARVALKWRVDDLSKATGVGWARIQNMEKSDESIQNPQIDKIISILNAKGITFEENEDNYLAYIKVKNENDSLEIKAPTVANLEITELCNVKCKHCYNPWRDETMGINSLDLLKLKNDKTIKKIRSFSCCSKWW